MILDGKITISRVNGGGSGDWISVDIHDSESATTFVEIKMSMEDFAYAITGHGRMPCKYELNSIDRIGLKKEVKSEVISIPLSVSILTANNYVINELLSQHETDGWQANRRDLLNVRNIVKTDDVAKFIRVSFSRYVDNQSLDMCQKKSDILSTT